MPRTTDRQFPPSSLFSEPPLGDGEIVLMETPLQTVARLQHATTNLQQLVAELTTSRWDHATGQERRFLNQHPPSPSHELSRGYF